MNTPLLSLPNLFIMAKPPHLLDRVRDKIGLKSHSIRTEQAYVQWVIRVIQYHDRYPTEMG